MAVKLDLADFEQFCHNQFKPWMLGGLFTVWLTQHFSLASNIEDENLRQFIWTDTHDTTKLVIDNVTRYDPKLVGKRPAILLKRNASTNVRLGIADRLFNYTPTGQEYFVTFWQGSHTIFCIGASGAEAEHLGVEVAREIGQFSWTVARALNLFKLQVAQIGEIAKLEEAKENFVVPIVVTYAYEEGTMVTQDAPLLNKIQLSFFTP